MATLTRFRRKMITAVQGKVSIETYLVARGFKAGGKEFVVRESRRTRTLEGGADD